MPFVPGIVHSKNSTIRNQQFTPDGVLNLDGKNTGDAAGDLAFFLSRRALTQRCSVEPKLNFGQWNVTMNINRNNFGPYYSCIPEYTAADFSSWNVSLYSCNQDCNHPTVPGIPDGCTHVEKNNTKGPDGQTTCFCSRATLSVGRYGSPPLPPLPASPHSHPKLPADGFPAAALPAIRGCTYGGLTPVQPDNRSVACPRGTVVDTHYSSTNNTADFVGECCDACVGSTVCDGYRILKSTKPGAAATCTLMSYTAGSNIAAATTPLHYPLAEDGDAKVGGVGGAEMGVDALWCGSYSPGVRIGGSWNWEVADMMAATAPATAGVGRGLITDDVSDVGSISTSDSREINLSPAQPQPSQCSWQIRGAPRFVEASCVLDRVDSFVEALPEMSECLAKFNVSNASHPKVSRNSNRWFRCYWEMVGGGGFHPVVDYHKLIAEFERAFAVDADGCAPVVANGK
eukprot:gene12143-7815_t